MEPISFLDGISGYVRNSTGSAADKSIRLAVIDPAYNAFTGLYPNAINAAKVTFEGETTLSGKEYPVANGYMPTPGARVWMVPIGNSWLIAGAAASYTAQGFYAKSDGTLSGIEFGEGNYFDSTQGLVLTTDAEIQGDLTVGGVGAVRYKRKLSAAPNRTNATVAIDPELQGLFLDVGVWDVQYFLVMTGVNGDIQGNWSFTGTWAGTKSVIGASATTEANPNTNSLGKFSVHQFGTNVAYGLNSTSTFTGAIERGIATVTVAGNAGYNWAQETTDATASAIQAGSFIRAERVA